MDNDYQKFLGHSARAILKTAEALPASSGNPFIREKVAHSIDKDKVDAMSYLVKVSSLTFITSLAPAAAKGLALGAGSAGALAIGAPYIAGRATKASVEQGEEKAKEYLKYLIPAAAILGIGGTARAGLLGDKAQGAATSVTDSIANLFGYSKDEPVKAPVEDSVKAPVEDSPKPAIEAYKVAAAKTFYKLSTAKDSCTNSVEREKISQAHDECAQILFDCIFYL